MPNVQRGPIVGKNMLNYDKEGRVIDVDNLKKQIFKGVI
jgi:hypothetical protein